MFSFALAIGSESKPVFDGAQIGDLYLDIALRDCPEHFARN
jgi:hypothetical protein